MTDRRDRPGRASIVGETANDDNSAVDKVVPQAGVAERPVEIGGRAGPDPTRYGDWEKGGRCIDF